MGRPLFECASGSDSDGWPVMLNGGVKPKVCAWRSSTSRGSRRTGSMKPTFGTGVDSTGVSSTSIVVKTRKISRVMALIVCQPRMVSWPGMCSPPFQLRHVSGSSSSCARLAAHLAHALAHGGREVRGKDRTAGRIEFAVVDAEAAFFDVMAERLQLLGGVAQGGGDFGIDRFAARRFFGEGNAQAAGRGRHFQRIRPRLGRRGIGRVGFGHVDAIEHGGAIAHGARDDVMHAVAVAETAVVFRALRHAVLRHLHADEAAARRRNADRTQPVRSVGKRHDAGCDRARRSAGRAAGDVVGVPRIAAGP